MSKGVFNSPKTRKFRVWARIWNGKKSMEYGERIGAVQAGNWPMANTSSVIGIEVRARSALDAIRKVQSRPLAYFNYWDSENEVIGVDETGSGRYEWECKCDATVKDRYGRSFAA